MKKPVCFTYRKLCENWILFQMVLLFLSLLSRDNVYKHINSIKKHI